MSRSATTPTAMTRANLHDCARSAAGIPFGIRPGMTTVARQRDRRAPLGDLLTRLARSLTTHRDVSLMRGVFEQTLADALPLSSVHLRDRTDRSLPAGERAPGIESIAVDVPGPPGGVLEATFRPGAIVGDWDFQLLGLAAQIGALVLEVERGRTQLVRAGLLPGPRPRRDGAAPLIGSTDAIQALRRRIERIAETDFTVLLEGESGAGKELVAQQIHELSNRKNGPFVAVNCAALVETLLEAELFGIEERTATGVRGRRGKFEQADGGTLFLDEISDLSVSAQAKLLRAIQELTVERVGGHVVHRVNVRIIAATNRSLAELVDRRQFRADLFYRLSGVDIRVPPLRERRADVLELAKHFLERHRAHRVMRLSAAAADALIAYDWPGNVRELERLMERAVALAASEVIDLADLPDIVRRDFADVLLPSIENGDTMRAWAIRYARIVLERCGGNKREASRRLGISPHTLSAYLKQQTDIPEIAEVCAET
jgi:DNA-binding NtrC family response regulator